MKLDRDVAAAHLGSGLRRFLLLYRRNLVFFFEVFIKVIKVSIFVEQVFFHKILKQILHKTEKKIKTGGNANDNSCSKKYFRFLHGNILPVM